MVHDEVKQFLFHLLPKSAKLHVFHFMNELPSSSSPGFVGDRSDINNYRAILFSFERLLASQISKYFESNIFFNGQHEFRRGHSCQTTLHEYLSLDNKNLQLYHYLPILEKLLISQIVPLEKEKSKPSLLKLSVPQGSAAKKTSWNGNPSVRITSRLDSNFLTNSGSVLGKFKIKTFADDTKISYSDKDLENALINFSTTINSLNKWCSHNKIDINWCKTYRMIFSNKRSNFSDKLACSISLVVNKKLFSIRRFFNLSTSEYKI
ncbi:hypothetical protein BpHYR1_017927 [Brachionus plicatilis]|uniref:RNA-directed DNA polymerase from mobile element jockey-like n=1 Tax=Brachionus plicatilis TaxID=10195 RepID=A0A3M7SXK0_BRAPC|nr:hypothetical protein BpHYR1_017927 [Brachionus plicatilis]